MINEWVAMEKHDSKWRRLTCRRCRAKVLLVFWEGRVGARDNGSPFMEDNDSKGLVRKGGEFTFWEQQWKTMAVYDTLGDNFEPWEEIFVKLNI